MEQGTTLVALPRGKRFVCAAHETTGSSPRTRAPMNLRYTCILLHPSEYPVVRRRSSSSCECAGMCRLSVDDFRQSRCALPAIDTQTTHSASNYGSVLCWPLSSACCGDMWRGRGPVPTDPHLAEQRGQKACAEKKDEKTTGGDAHSTSTMLPGREDLEKGRRSQLEAQCRLLVWYMCELLLISFPGTTRIGRAPRLSKRGEELD